MTPSSFQVNNQELPALPGFGAHYHWDQQRPNSPSQHNRRLPLVWTPGYCQRNAWEFLFRLSHSSLCLFHHCRSLLKNYQHFLALVFAIIEVNKDLTLLPNTTLGFRIYDHRDILREMEDISLSLLSTRAQRVPNYKCDRQNPLLSIIGGLDSQSSREISSLMGIYKIPQVWGFIWGEMWGTC